ncbi:MAG: TetR/AcrR family transcriptional regulator C-terminal domain-containing protein [Clostridia bacterium]|nr:TetR/AcrR family transcriptional regulator C-terminal domain-containing protein [Clostridia bacterium]
MADSGITKKALAMAFLRLTEREHISQITIGEICEICEMNRKSFYYHFRDKYDLIIWIYDNELESYNKDSGNKNVWDLFENICYVLDGKRKFYRKAFELSEGNSLKNHIGELFSHVIREDLIKKAGNFEGMEDYIEFIKDSLVTSIEKWLNKREYLKPEVYTEFIKKCFYEAGRI